jgi:hypothetical protein
MSVFEPVFDAVDEDVERSLIYSGMRGSCGPGGVKWPVWAAAYESMLDLYFQREAFEALVDNACARDWAHGDNAFLSRLTDELDRRELWPLLKRLWDSVLKARRGNHASSRRYNRSFKDLPPDSFYGPDWESEKVAYQLLVASLERVIALAERAGGASDAAEYRQQLAKARKAAPPAEAPSAAKTFTPQFKAPHRDIIRFTTYFPERESEARKEVIRLYFEHCAHGPLIAWLGAWPWVPRHDADGIVPGLLDALRDREHWPLLKRLFDVLLAPRQRRYDSALRAWLKSPKRPTTTLDESEQALAELLDEVIGLAEGFGSPEDVGTFRDRRRGLAEARKAA